MNDGRTLLFVKSFNLGMMGVGASIKLMAVIVLGLRNAARGFQPINRSARYVVCF